MSAPCCVANCHHKSKITFHSPTSRPHLELWKKILKINVDNFYVCDQHFEEKFFRIDKRLTIDAFPTQYIGNLEGGNVDFCQCCMKAFVRSKFITLSEPRFVIDEKCQQDFKDTIGCELPSGVICQKCFDSIKNIIKFRNDIREKQKNRMEILQKQQERQHKDEMLTFGNIDVSVNIKEESIDQNEFDSSDLKIKTEPADGISQVVIKQEADASESFLISEIKAEPEEMQEVIAKTTVVKINQQAIPRQTIVIKRPGGSNVPASSQSFKIIPPSKIVKIMRTPDQQNSRAINSLGPSAKISNEQGSINISTVQLTQMENSTNLLGFKCQYCPNRFIERRFVVEHIKQKHTFPCSQCSSVFPFKITLIKHQMSMHSTSGGPQYSKTPIYRHNCRICGLKFLSSYTLDAHMVQIHNRALIEEKINTQDDNIIIIRPLSMPTKSSTTAPPKQLPVAKPSTAITVVRKALQPSTSQVKVKEEQPIEFEQKVSMKMLPTHNKTVTTLIRKILAPAPAPPPEPIVEDPDGIPCLDCGLLLRPDKLLKHRMDAHDIDTHNIIYVCDLCGIEIKGKTHLINHMNVKHLSSNYARCEFCDGHFESKTDMIVHKNMQHNFNGTRYTCHFCYKIFGNQRDMIVHRKVHYSEKGSRDKLARVFCKKFKAYEPKGAQYK